MFDASVALQYATSEALPASLSDCYYRTIFLVPPWTEIYVSDSERRHRFVEAISEFERLKTAYQALGYNVTILPKTNIKMRADLVLAELSSGKYSIG
jgi:predicted ATPase